MTDLAIERTAQRIKALTYCLDLALSACNEKAIQSYIEQITQEARLLRTLRQQVTP